MVRAGFQRIEKAQGKQGALPRAREMLVAAQHARSLTGFGVGRWAGMAVPECKTATGCRNSEDMSWPFRGGEYVCRTDAAKILH
ncbi:hypothetical protein GCM10023166_30980 [Paeniglutamicibacter cryotolerans]